MAYILAQEPLWSVLKQIGVPAESGYVYTYQTGTNIPQAVALNPAGTAFQTNPIRLDQAGQCIAYWNVGEGMPLYRLQIYDRSKNLILTVDNYPSVSTAGGGDITVYVDLQNYARNEQFTFWLNGVSFDNDALIVGKTPIADEWYFDRDTQTPDISITRETFAPGLSNPASTPVHYLHYVCTSAASATKQDILQKYGSVQSLNNEQVTVYFSARTSDAGTFSTITLVANQFFGAGGSPDVTLTFDIDIDDTWQVYSQTFVVPNTTGKVIGSNNDDYLSIGFRPQINQVIAIDLVNIQFQPGVGTGASNFPYETTDDQYTRILAEVLKSNNTNQGTDIIGVTGKPEYIDLTEFDDEIEPRNYLICGDMYTNPRQFGQIQDSTTIVPNNDGTYIADGVILISDGDNVVSQSSLPGLPLIFTIVTDNRKWGIFQIIEAERASDLFNRYASAAAQIQTGNSGGDVAVNWKVAILGYTGTAGAEPRQVVTPGLWNGAAVNPTLAAGWTYLQVSEAFTSHTGGYWEDNTPTGGVNNVSIPTPGTLTNFKTIGVMLWVDDATPFSVDDLTNIRRWNLTPTKHIAPVEFVGSEEAELQAQRYYQKSYPSSSAIAWGYSVSKNEANLFSYANAPLPLNTGNLGALTPPSITVAPLKNITVNWDSGSVAADAVVIGSYPNQIVKLPLKQEMASIPTITLFNSDTGISGTATAYYDFEIVSSTSPNISAAVFADSIDGNQTMTSHSNISIPVVAGAATPNQIMISSGDFELFYIEAYAISPNPAATVTINFPDNIIFGAEYIADALLGV